MADDGQTNTQTEEPKDANNASGKTDGCIGSRRMRTFIIGGLLIAWSLWFFSYFGGLGIWGVLNGVAMGIICVCCIIAIVLHCLGKDGGIETIIGWILLVGACIYMVVQVLIAINGLLTFGYLFQYLATAALPGCTALFLALDIIKDFMSDEGRRLFANLTVLAAASGAGCLGYIQVYSFFAQYGSAFGLGGFTTGLLMVSIGYALALIGSLLYLILFLCKCCTCNCKDNKCIRIVIAIILLLGGLLIGIGYFLLVGFSGLYYVGFAILIAGLCVVWALDMGIVDQVKGGGDDPQSA